MEPDQRAGKGKARRAAAVLLRLIGAFVVALLLMEAALRLAGYRLPARMPQEQFGLIVKVKESEVPGLGFTLRPGGRGETVYPGRRPEDARRVIYQVNDRGFRDDPIDPVKPRGVTRVALLGDSVTYGTGINLDETLGRHLEAALQERLPHRRLQVLNCGVPATNTGQQVALLRHRVLDLAPDLVVVCMTIVDATGYGIQDPGRGRPWEAALVARLGLTSGVYDAPELNPAQRRTMWLRRHSVFADLVCHQVYRALYGRVLLANYRAAWRADAPGVQRIQRALWEASRLAQARGIGLHVAMYPFLSGLDGDYPFAEETARLAGICARLDLPFTDLLEPLCGERPERLKAHLHDRHPNGRANALVARHLADALVHRMSAPAAEQR